MKYEMNFDYNNDRKMVSESNEPERDWNSVEQEERGRVGAMTRFHSIPEPFVMTRSIQIYIYI
jgi:hypothetical protein